ncbi:hypothetical protein H4R22_000452 [Coemansia sp. RSA 1290]|nr:hypothetical protein H4R22_000452 [Coemansia sp. RSA 1290]KAJ2646809.1 hypothetical protein IWW40_005169 [Coemansia sp. RSA 1250]
MMDILDKVSEAEESRVNKKIQRQQTIKKLVAEKAARADEKKKKKSSRLEEIKRQLQKGHSLGTPEKPTKKNKKSKKVKPDLARTLSSINREWSSAFEDDRQSSSDDAAHETTTKPRKMVSFDV